MGNFSLWVVILTILMMSWDSSGCWEEERIALLNVKDDIKYIYGKSLISWVDDKKSDCCEWPKVMCNNMTKRVVGLSLNSIRDESVGYWYMNASLFLPFKNLNSLNLSRNNLGGVVEDGGLDKLSKLSTLETLDVSFNNLNRSILTSLSQLSSLKFLYLLANPLNSPPNYPGRERLTGLKNLELLNMRSTEMEDENVLSALNLKDFVSLKELVISYNNFQSFGPINDIQGQDGPKKLENLNLFWNGFSNNIFKSLKGLPSLKILNLGCNLFDGTLQVEDINALKNLEDLDLSSNSIEGFQSSSNLSDKIINNSHLQVLHLNYILSNMSNMLESLVAFPSIKTLELKNTSVTNIDAIHALRNLSNLEELFLDDSFLHNDFLQSIRSMSSLKVLSLPRCLLRATTLPNKGWCELKNLQELALSANHFEGELPPCLGNLTSLQLVDLSLNRLTGNIALSPLLTLMSLEYLSISSNFFEVPSSFKPFANHSNLKFLFVDANEAIAEIELQNIVPKFQLHLFTMSNCIGLLNLPTFLHYQHELRILRISRNNFEGEVPNWLLQNNTKLQAFYMRGNSFKGVLKWSPQLNLNLEAFDVSNNKLSGEIPNNLSSTFPNLLALNLSYNLFEGQIPFLGNLKYLKDLDLSNNFLSREIPKELLMGCQSLFSLTLSNNKLQGEIVQEFAYLSLLSGLYLAGNNFTGTISDSLSNIPLRFLDISENNFFGKIPRWMGHVKSLEELALSKNHLEGPIPIEFCNLNKLTLLDLSENNLTGSIPSCLNPSSIRHVRLSKNRLGGQLSSAFFNNKCLVIFDLSHNSFVGRIPQWIGSMSKLSILLLGGNQFEGVVPIQVCQLTRLSLLDLSDNHLSGPIPHCLSKMSLEVTNEKFTANKYTVTMDFSLLAYMSSVMSTRPYHVSFGWENGFGIDPPTNDVPTRVEFRTKGNLYYYEGIVLKYMSGIDLSNNKFAGEIPLELGNLTGIHALNLSHNNLSSTIPETFAMLHNIESLDLSYNELTGTIPNNLLELNSLAVFSVAFNNLTGAIPEAKAQFATFDQSSYEGNPFLCGPPLDVECNSPKSSSPLPFSPKNDIDQDGWMDMEDFYLSFWVCYGGILLGLILVLYINPSWRCSWFFVIDNIFISCFTPYEKINV